MSDQRSAEAAEYRKLYKTAAWRTRRTNQLSAEPLCAFCRAAGLTTAATIADHIVPHRGDLDLFWYGDLQSLCKAHHDSAKQREEKGGWDSMADLAGYPLDPNHPANLQR